MKTVITFICIVISTHLYAQNPSNSASKGMLLKEFKGFLDRFCHEGSDTLLRKSDSVMKYRVVFTSQGYFIDPKDDLIRLCNIKNIKKEKGFVEMVLLKNHQDSLGSNFYPHSCLPIKTCMMNHYLGEPLEDSIVNIQSEPTFWASCIYAKKMKLPKSISISSDFDSIIDQNTVETPSVVSYQSGKYLIVDMMMATQMGNQTDSGLIFTFYLQRID